MKKLAIIYLIMETLSNLFLIGKGITGEASGLLIFWLRWPVNLLGLLAIVGYVLNRRILNTYLWRIILIVFIGFRAYELIPGGLIPSNAHIEVYVLVALRYIWLVVPPTLAIWYMGFKHDKKNSIIKN